MASDQLGPHPDLDARVERHRRHAFRRPPHTASVAAFERAGAWLAAQGAAPLILDIGCGTGDSSRALAHAHPDAAVVGIDKSAARLIRRRRTNSPDNLLLLQANALDVLPRARAAGWRCDRVALYYPNPWPKAAQLNKRWHGSPVFADLIALGGQLELRCNWRTYADEMQLALRAFGVASEVGTLAVATPISLFEAKYAASGHTLWRLTANLGAARLD